MYQLTGTQACDCNAWQWQRPLQSYSHGAYTCISAGI